LVFLTQLSFASAKGENLLVTYSLIGLVVSVNAHAIVALACSAILLIPQLTVSIKVDAWFLGISRAKLIIRSSDKI
jgi:hypothetical protein